MTTNFIPLDKNKHAALKININHRFEFAKDTHISAVTLRELAQVATCMPVVFIQDKQSNRIHTVAMMGIEQNTNLYCNSEGHWQGHMAPLNLQRFPFDVRQDGEQLAVFIDENSDLLVEDGEPLFTEAGEATEFLDNRQKLLADIANSEMITQRFIARLEELDLFEEIQMMVGYADGKQRNITGMMTISEKKLNELADDVILDLKKTGFLGAIYAALLSLGQMNRLVQLSATSDSPVRAIQISNVKKEQEQSEEATA